MGAYCFSTKDPTKGVLYLHTHEYFSFSFFLQLLHHTRETIELSYITTTTQTKQETPNVVLYSCQFLDFPSLIYNTYKSEFTEKLRKFSRKL